jgi:hypothetical protein
MSKTVENYKPSIWLLFFIIWVTHAVVVIFIHCIADALGIWHNFFHAHHFGIFGSAILGGQIYGAWMEGKHPKKILPHIRTLALGASLLMALNLLIMLLFFYIVKPDNRPIYQALFILGLDVFGFYLLTKQGLKMGIEIAQKKMERKTKLIVSKYQG